MSESRKPYPASLSVDYPDRELNRLTSFFRLITVIPIAIILALVSNAAFNSDDKSAWMASLSAGGMLFLATMLMLVFRQKYPRWWFDWNLALTKFGTRVGAYVALLRDEYPSTDEDQSVHIEIPYPDAKNGLNRWLPLVKWLLAVPHYIILFFLVIAAFFAVIVAWFAILFTGRYPKGLFDFVVGVMRWSLRVSAYAALLTTDSYPPFTLGEQAS
jgi:small-conductance mechanosensitive channel